MTVDKRPSLRKCVNDNCKSCIYDPEAAGSWRQQVTLCSVTGCALYPARPITKAPILESVLDYYRVPGNKRALYAHSRPREGRISRQSMRPSSLSPVDTMAEGKGQFEAVSKALDEICD